MSRTPRIIIAIVASAALVLTAAAVALSFRSSRAASPMVGIVAARGTVSIEATDQLGVQGALVVSRVVVPGPSWIAVYTEGMNGMPGIRAGLVQIPGGESRSVRIPFDPTVRLTEKAIVVVHGDRGIIGVFEYDEGRFAESPDKPYWVGGVPVETKVWVRFYEMGNSFAS